MRCFISFLLFYFLFLFFLCIFWVLLFMFKVTEILRTNLVWQSSPALIANCPQFIYFLFMTLTVTIVSKIKCCVIGKWSHSRVHIGQNKYIHVLFLEKETQKKNLCIGTHQRPFVYKLYFTAITLWLSYVKSLIEFEFAASYCQVTLITRSFTQNI